MQVTETKTEGLLHEFTVVVPAATIEEHVTGRLTEMSKTARLPGFRPGKVPVALLRKQYGPSIMGEVLEHTVNETSQKAINDNKLTPAMQPKIEVTKFDEGGDLEYTMAVEVMPEIEMMDFSKLNLERMIVKADEDEINKSLERLANAHKISTPIAKPRESKTGDGVVIDFVGKVGGEEFPGGKAESYVLELGSGSFIPGFEDQLVGVKPGDHVEVKVTFPKEYGAEDLAGKDAVFDVDVKELQESAPAAIDDELAKKVGLDSLDVLKTSIREEHEREFMEASRQRLKREILDQLDDGHDFEVPQGLVEAELESIWTQYQEHRKHDAEHGHDHDHSEDEGKTDEEIKESYRDVAERRVGLFLLLSEVGRHNNLVITQDDLNKGMMAEAKRYPGQEQMVLDYYSKNPEAMQSLNAPLMEDKVVDFIIEMAKVKDKKVSIDELMKEPEQAPKKAPAAKSKTKAKKKAPAKKTAAAKKAPAKKKPATKKAKK